MSKSNIDGRDLRRRRLSLFVYCLLVSFCVLTVCSRSSFIYPMNDWVDVQCFFTVGRGIKHGLLPYRDLVEQKGPLLYVLFAVAALISEHSFVGVFAIEVVFFALFLYESARIVLLYARPAALLALPVIATAIAASYAFYLGTSSEELFLPFLAFSLRVVFTQAKRDEPLTQAQTVALGVCAAFALWSKYTFCGFYIGLAAAIVLWYALSGHAKRLPAAFLGAVVGVGLVSALVLLWFGLAGGLSDLWEIYFIDNITLYPEKNGLKATIKLLCRHLLQNPTWVALAGAGVVWLLTRFKRASHEALVVILSGLGLLTFTYIGSKHYPYYFMIMSVYVPLGLIPISRLLLERIPLLKPWARAIIVLAVTLLCVFVGFHTSQSPKILRYQKEDLPQYAFAKTINENTPDAVILNYGCLDYGFYYTTGSQPINRFFCKLNAPIPGMMEECDALVKEGAFDYIISYKGIAVPKGPYKIIQKKTYYKGRKKFVFRLYRNTALG